MKSREWLTVNRHQLTQALTQPLRNWPKPRSQHLASVLGILLVGSGVAFRYENSPTPTIPQSFQSLAAQMPKAALNRPISLQFLQPSQPDKASVSKTAPAQKAPQPQATKPTTPTPQPKAEPAAAAVETAVKPTAAPAPLSTGLTIDAVLEMRVALAKNADFLSIGASTNGILMDMNGQVLSELQAQTSYPIQTTGQGLTLGNQALPAAIWLEASAGGYILVGDRWYRGRLLLIDQGEGLYAINYVPLRDYLYGVVGSEVSPSWPMAALKAQAIAARSYALTHNIRPASSLYDLDDTPRFQAYGGVAKESNTTQIAVNETAGEFISYQGGIVESLYAASDQIVAEAHGGQGMSQLGALDLAEQGYDYLHILGRYYPGTALGRLEIEPE